MFHRAPPTIMKSHLIMCSSLLKILLILRACLSFLHIMPDALVLHLKLK